MSRIPVLPLRPRPVGVALLLALVLAVPATAQDDAPDRRGPAIRPVPEELDLGTWAAGQPAPGTLWLMNTRDRTIRVTAIEPDDDTVAVGIAVPAFVPPFGALEIPLTLRAPTSIGDRSRRSIRFSFAGFPALTTGVEVVSVHPDVHTPPPPSVDRPAAIRVAPAELDLGAASPGEPRLGSAWLVNQGRTAVRITAAKGSCGCMEIIDFEPFPLMPGQAAEFPLSMHAVGAAGQVQVKHATFVLDDREAVVLPVRIEALHPRAAQVRRHLAARDRFEAMTARAYLARPSRTWHGSREGPGTIVGVEEAEHRADWDRLLRTTAHYQDFDVDEQTVSVFVTRTNDLHRLLEVSPDPVKMTFWINEEREIEGVLLSDREEETLAGERWSTFLEWLERTHPAALPALRPEGRFVRTGETASRWRDLIVAWRQTALLPAIAVEAAP